MKGNVQTSSRGKRLLSVMPVPFKALLGLVLFLFVAVDVRAVCSSGYYGLATINEVFRLSQGSTNEYFIEVKALSGSLTSADYDNWTLESCTASGCTGSILLSNADDSDFPWIVADKNEIGNKDYINLNGSGTFIILKDAAGDTIDYFSINGYTNGIDTSCTPAFDWSYTVANSNTKNVRRTPDGVGSWGDAPGNSAGDTEGSDNNSGSSGGPTITAGNASAEQGQPLNFTVSLSAASGSDITLNYTTQDQSATAGIDYVADSGSILISAGQTSATIQINTLSSGASVDRTLWLVLQSASTGSISGQIGVGTIQPVPIRLTSANGSCAQRTDIILTFSKDVEQSSAESVSNYQLVNAAGASIALNSATRTTSNTVTLSAAVTLNDLTQYTVTVNNVEDLDGEVIAANSSDAFSLSCQANCYVESFSGPGALSSDWYAAGSAGSFGTPRVVRDGAMRLTDASNSVATVANLLLQFPGAENRIEVEFDYYAYNGSGADGIAVTFSDATITPVPGSYGGALGYAQRNNGTPGFAGGWLGVGIDEYGNFSAANEGKQGGSGFARDAVALRGSGSGTSGYPYLTSTGTLSPGIDQGSSTLGPGHRYKIILDHTVGGGQAFVEVQRDTGSGYTTIIPSFDVFTVNPSQAAVPSDWVVSFTGSTGGATNIHEIENLQICAAQPISAYNLVDHYHISHSGTGLTCEAEAVTVTAHDASHNAVMVNSNTALTISTSPSVDAVIPASPVILAGDSAVTFNLNQSSAGAAIDIDVSDGSATDLDDGGSEDPPIAFLDTAFRFYADGSYTGTSPIGTQISGKDSDTGAGSQSLTIRAVRTNTDTGACEAAIQGLTDVGIAYECNSPTSCTAGNQMKVEGNASSFFGGTNNGASLSYTDVELNFDANGEAPFLFAFGDVGLLTLYAHLDVAANSPEPAFSLDGASNAFVVRPFAFDLDFGGQRAADWADDGSLNDSTGSNASYAADSNGSVLQTAGDNVAMQVRAVQWQQLDDLDNDGVPDAGADLSDNNTTPNFGNEASGAGTLSFSHSLNQPATGSLGSLTAASLTVGGSSSDFSAGVANTTFTWDEVGIIDLSATLNNYLADPSADATGVAVNVGRFVPDRFVVTPSNGTFDDACGTFSYIGQRFGYATPPSATILAQNSSGGTTSNYTTGGFLKLGASSITRTFSNADNSALGTDGSTLMVAATDMIAGSGTLVTTATPGELLYTFDAGDTFVYTKNANAEVVPFVSSLTVAASALADSDSVAAATLPSWTPTGTALRYGRWVMENTYGPETQTLAMGAHVEYLDASGNFVLNTADNCSTLVSAISTSPAGTAGAGSISGITVGAGSSTLSFQSTLISGEGGFSFSAPYNSASPGLNYTGSVDVDVDLSAVDWLRYDWDADGSLEDHPTRSATFGQYRGNDRIIYWREVEN